MAKLILWTSRQARSFDGSIAHPERSIQPSMSDGAHFSTRHQQNAGTDMGVQTGKSQTFQLGADPAWGLAFSRMVLTLLLAWEIATVRLLECGSFRGSLRFIWGTPIWSICRL